MNKNWKIVSAVVVALLVLAVLVSFSKKSEAPVSVPNGGIEQAPTTETSAATVAAVNAQAPATGSVDDAVNALMSDATAEGNTALSGSAVDAATADSATTGNVGTYEQF